MKNRKSIKYIAKLAGVSPTTVQNVLHERKQCMREETYQRVRMILKEEGYIEMAAPKLLNGKTKNVVGIVVSEEILEAQIKGEAAIELFLLEKENFKKQCYTLLRVCSKIDEIADFFQAWPTVKIYLCGFSNEEKRKLEEKTDIVIDTLM